MNYEKIDMDLIKIGLCLVVFGDYSIIWNKIYHNAVYSFEPLINNFNLTNSLHI